ncbi:MAG: TonB-dependent receptor [Bacteroidetes bacterium]|nr:TonB-dependent receptor [Bacteroidota bacterium]
MKPLALLSPRAFVTKVLKTPIALAGIMLCISPIAEAQQTREQVTIIGTFQPSLKEATKITLLPEPVGNPMQAGDQPLTRVEQSLEVRIEPEPVSPVQTELNESKNIYRNHLNLGAGTNLSPVFDFFHSSALSKTVALNVQTSHRSSWTQVRDYAPSAWMNNKARLGTEIALGEQSIEAGLAYNFDRLHWYGFKPADYPLFDSNAKNILQHFSLFSADARWKTRFRDPESVNHYLGLNLDFFGDRHKSFEHAFALSGGASKQMNLLPVDGSQYVLIDASMAYTAEGDTVMEKSTLAIHARPAAGLKGSFYSIEAGLGLSSVQAGKTYFHLLPEIEARLFVFQDRMNIFASFGGRLEHHSRRMQLAENPWLRSTDTSFVTTIPFEFRAGIKGNPAKGLQISLSYEHMTAEQMGFFITDTTSAFQHMYTTVFDDLSRDRFSFGLRYEPGNKMRAEMMVHVDTYQMTSLAQPWHLPGLQLVFNGWYPVDQKWTAKAGLNLMNERYAPAAGGAAQKLKNITDIALGAEYRHNEQLWFYATAENILNQRYPRFDRYPVQGAQLVAGMKLNF